MERLQKILSKNAIASRREAEELIKNGRVKVNGVIAALGQSAQPGIDEITVDGVPVSTVEKRIYLMLNKPRGFLSTVKDDRGRKTVMELVKDVNERVFPIGRLDLDSEGLLLFTNDGEFANTVMHPSFKLHKTYRVETTGDIKKAIILMNNPMEIDGISIKAIKAVIKQETKNGGILEITIAEGRNRQIRKMCNTCGLKVKALKRISIGNLELGELKNGHWRYLTNNEVLSIGKRHITYN